MAAPRAFEMRRRELARINRRDTISDEEVYLGVLRLVDEAGDRGRDPLYGRLFVKCACNYHSGGRG